MAGRSLARINGFHFSHGLINMKITSTGTTIKASGHCTDSHQLFSFSLFLNLFHVPP